MINLKDGESAAFQVLVDIAASLRIIASSTCESNDEYSTLHSKETKKLISEMKRIFGDDS